MYRVSDVEQNTPEWLLERAKYVTGSIFHSLLSEAGTKKDRDAGKLSASAYSSLYTIVAAYDGGVKPDIKTKRLDQSHEDEKKACADYEFIHDTDLKHTDSFLISTKYKYAALSPDGLEFDGDDIKQGVEIKCLDVGNHVKVLMQEDGTGIDKKYLAQMEWYCFVLGIDKCKYFGFNNSLGKLSRYEWIYTMTDERREEIEVIYLKFEAKVDEALNKVGLL